MQQLKGLKGIRRRDHWHFSCLYPEDIQSDYRNTLQVTCRGKYETEGWRIRKDRSRFWAEVAIAPLREEGETGLVPANRDITERKQVEEALRLRDRAIAAASDAILIAGPRN